MSDKPDTKDEQIQELNDENADLIEENKELGDEVQEVLNEQAGETSVLDGGGDDEDDGSLDSDLAKDELEAEGDDFAARE